MSAIKIAPDIYWAGAIDWDTRSCGAYATPRGTTYNAYLIMDEKITLIDTVKEAFTEEMLQRVRSVVDPAKIDTIIVQHAELDHAGAMDKVMEICPKARLIATQAGKDILLEHFKKDWQVEVVKTGDEVSIGKRELMFIQAAMLHWPDNMFTYIKEEGILFSNDAFGAHIAASNRFADEIGAALVDEASKYYAVIVSPYASFVQKKLAEVQALNIPLTMIAPAHGAIWRDPQKIIDFYATWSSGNACPRATVVFDTMWHSTEKMAHALAQGIMAAGKEVSVYNIRQSDTSVVIRDILASQLLLVGTPTLNMGMYPSIAGFLHFLRGLKPLNKKGVVFGSFGWGKGGVESAAEELEKMNIPVIETVKVKYIPSENALAKCFELGKKLGDGLE